MIAYRNNNMQPTAKSKAKNFALASGDVTILRAMYEYRFMRREHLSLLTQAAIRSDCIGGY